MVLRTVSMAMLGGALATTGCIGAMIHGDGGPVTSQTVSQTGYTKIDLRGKLLRPYAPLARQLQHFQPQAATAAGNNHPITAVFDNGACRSIGSDNRARLPTLYAQQIIAMRSSIRAVSDEKKCSRHRIVGAHVPLQRICAPGPVQLRILYLNLARIRRQLRILLACRQLSGNHIVETFGEQRAAECSQSIVQLASRFVFADAD